MKYQLHPDAWEAVDFNTALKINDNENNQMNEIVAECEFNEKIIEETNESNNRKKYTLMEYKNKYYAIKNKKLKEIQSYNKRRASKRIENMNKVPEKKKNNKRFNDNYKYVTTLIKNPKIKTKKLCKDVNFSIAFPTINSWFKLYIGYTILMIYLLLIIYYRSQFDMYPVNVIRVS
uniref:Uncharacterized protein n=1 Tax=Parastrongyloides trichosuri TaxID=131310 RepID=A0A0N4ZPB5_PARTI